MTTEADLAKARHLLKAHHAIAMDVGLDHAIADAIAIAREKAQVMVYDKGGFVPPAATWVRNDTGQDIVVTPRCWTFADDEDPDCPIGAVRCVLLDKHDGEHVFEARP